MSAGTGSNLLLRHRGIPIIIVAVVILLASIFWLVISHAYTQNHMGHQPLSAFQRAQQSVSFALLVPKHLPRGYSYHPGSLSLHASVAVFQINGPDNVSLAVTEQAKPSGYDFSQLSGTEEFSTPLGQAYVEDFDIRTTGSIVGQKTWLIVNTNTPIGSDAMKNILESFTTL